MSASMKGAGILGAVSDLNLHGGVVIWAENI